MAQDINVTLSNTNPIYLKNQSVDATAIANAAATAYANAVANAVALYQTTAGLSANVLTLTSNNSTNFGGVSLGTVQSQITSNAAIAYSNAVTISATDASNKSAAAYSNAIAKSDTAYSNAIAVAASLYAPLTGSVFTGPVSGITTLIVGNTNITGFVTVDTTLQVFTNTATFGTAAYFVANGNIGLGTSTPNSKLQVTGTANISGAVALGSTLSIAGALSGITTLAAGNTTITGFANVSTSLQVGTNTATFGTAVYHVANGNMGIATASPTQPLHVVGNTLIASGSLGIGTGISAGQTITLTKTLTGSTISYGINQNGAVQSDVTNQARSFNSTFNVANNTTFTTNFYNYGTVHTRPTALNTTISTLGGYFADASLVSGVANYGFIGSIPASSTFTITNVSLTSNIVTVTTSAAHVFWPGQTIVVAATTTTSINGSFTILTCPSTTTFTYALVLADITSTADTGSATVSTGRWNAYMNGTAPNYFAGQVTIGTANITNGYLAVAGTQSVTTSQLYVGGTNQFTGTTPIAIYCNATLTGTSAMTNVYGISLVPSATLAAGATVTNFASINNQPTLNSSTTPTNYYGTLTQLQFSALATGGTVTNMISYFAAGPALNASTTTNITTLVGFKAGNSANGTNQTITNIYGFQGVQNTQASSNAYNLFMDGTAKNYLAGNTGIGNTLPNATLAVTGTANVSGAVTLGSTLTTAGQLTVTTATSKVIIGTDSGGSLSLGRIDGTSSAPYIDFNSGATAVDYDARISVGAGNGTVGAATLTIAAGSLATGNTTITGALTTSSYSKTTATVVGSLVAAATAGAGARSFVTDSTVAASGNFGAIVAGTGANSVPVYSDGTNWRIG